MKEVFFNKILQTCQRKRSKDSKYEMTATLRRTWSIDFKTLSLEDINNFRN